jgi:hypothetical protein
MEGFVDFVEGFFWAIIGIGIAAALLGVAAIGFMVLS